MVRRHRAGERGQSSGRKIVRMLLFAGLLLGSFVSAASAQPSAEPVELTDRQMDQVTAGAGKVSMQDFHFVT